MDEAARRLMQVSTIPVRWGDMDAYAHVNNTVYFRYCEQARVEWVEGMGFMVHASAVEGPVVVSAACTFLVPVTYPATVRVEMYAGQPGRSSVMTWYELYVEGSAERVAEGSAKLVWMNHETAKSVPLPEELRRVLTA